MSKTKYNLFYVAFTFPSNENRILIDIQYMQLIEKIISTNNARLRIFSLAKGAKKQQTHLFTSRLRSISLIANIASTLLNIEAFTSLETNGFA